jgi:hypothetical protein
MIDLVTCWTCPPCAHAREGRDTPACFSGAHPSRIFRAAVLPSRAGSATSDALGCPIPADDGQVGSQCDLHRPALKDVFR